ncbi:MAG: phage major capsid protein [Candidatus Bathyarchaeia archaeon]
MPKLFEQLMKDPAFNAEVKEMLVRISQNPFYQRYIKKGIEEGLFSDAAQALGRMHDTVIEAAKPNLIGREIIWVRPTKEPLERFPKAKKGKAYVMAEGGKVYVAGEKYDKIDVSTNVIIKSAAEWTQEFLEDATWNVMDRQVAECGRNVAEKETELVLSLYNSIAASDLAGGAVLAGGGTAMDWNKVTALWDAVVNEDFSPKVLVLHPRQVTQLWRDDKFINSLYWGEGVDIRKGVLAETYLGMRIVTSTKCTNGTAYAIDTDVAAVMLIRRDLQTQDYEDPKNGVYGTVAHERIGLGVLQSKGVAKMTGISTTV